MYLQLAYGEAQVLDKIMYEEEVRREVFAFEQQFHYAVRAPPSRRLFSQSVLTLFG